MLQAAAKVFRHTTTRCVRWCWRWRDIKTQEDEKGIDPLQLLTNSCLPFQTRNGNKFKIVQKRKAHNVCSRSNFGHSACIKSML